MRRFSLATSLLVPLLALSACDSPDPKQELELIEFESYWAIESTIGSVRYLAPVARLVIRNRHEPESHAIQATAVFRIDDPEHADKNWTAWEQVAGGDHRLGVGETAIVLLRSDGRYYSTGPPESFFQHELFRDASVEVFFRVGSSEWVKFAEGAVPRRIGSSHVVLGEP